MASITSIGSDSDGGSVSAWLGSDIWSGSVFDGGWTSVSETAAVTSPGSGKVLGNIGMAREEDIQAACATAKQAQAAWAATSYEQRAAILRAAARVAEAHRADIVDWLVRESGSTTVKAEFEAEVSIKVLHEASAMPSQAHGQILPSLPGRLSIARRRPLGVVGIISPFNFPLYLAIRAVAPALAVGNSVVLKPDPRTAVCGGFSIARIFEEAGLPKGVLHVLPGGGAAGGALTSDPSVAMIQFTGSTAAGRKVGEAAGRHLKKVSLELGGKNALIILDDADLDVAAKAARWGVYLHQGQICMATGRVLVHEKIAERFVAELVESARNLSVGDPGAGTVALGPLINAAQVEHARTVVAQSVAAGAKLETGGDADGLFFNPTVLSNVAPGMPAFEEEIFAPVAVVTTFASDEEAIRIANDGEYGLSAGVITKSIERAMLFADQLNVGLLHINDQTVNEDAINPFGGTGASGNGSSVGGPANWEEFTQWQWLTMRGAPPVYPF